MVFCGVPEQRHLPSPADAILHSLKSLKGHMNGNLLTVSIVTIQAGKALWEIDGAVICRLAQLVINAKDKLRPAQAHSRLRDRPLALFFVETWSPCM